MCGLGFVAHINKAGTSIQWLQCFNIYIAMISRTEPSRIVDLLSAYDRVESCPDIYFPIVNLLTSPMIMHSKFVWSNLV